MIRVGLALLVSTALLQTSLGRCEPASTVDFAGLEITPRVPSTIGEVPGHWSLTRQGFRNEYVPDSGFGKGVFSVPFDVPQAIAFNLAGPACMPCVRIEGRWHQLPNDTRTRYAYRCKPGIEDHRAFFLASGESLGVGNDPKWIESRAKPPFPPGLPRTDSLHFHESITTYDVLPGRRLACSAWFQGAYPPIKAFNETRGDTTDLADYVILDRAIYLVDAKGRPEFLLRENRPLESGNATYERAFLPWDYSELEQVRFSYVYAVNGGFWLRIDFSQDFEGAGAESGMLLIEFRNGASRLVAGASDIMMY
jgi:hypothetical protein